MFHKFLAIAAVAAAPAIAHAQGTTTPTQDTTAMGHTQAHKDSSSVTSKKIRKHSGAMKDTTSMHTRTNTRMDSDSSSMNVSPVDSARMGVPSTRETSKPPR